MTATVQTTFTLVGDSTDAHLLRAALRAKRDQLINIIAEEEKQAKEHVHVEPALSGYRRELERVRRMLADLDD